MILCQTFFKTRRKVIGEMSSAAKALTLLSHFSTARPEIGLSQLCRIAVRDKATTYRHLQVLEAAGFVEKNPVTKHYRLGPAVMQLAQIREATVPRKASARAALVALADATGETAHVSVLSGATLYALDDCECPRHSIRAVIDINEFPLHATASGIVALAYGPDTLIETAKDHLDVFTQATPTKLTQLRDAVEAARTTGFGRANQSYEADIFGIAAPLFDHSDLFAGAVSVACVASRLNAELERIIKSELISAAREITRNWGGRVPSDIETAWSQSVTYPHALETMS